MNLVMENQSIPQFVNDPRPLVLIREKTIKYNDVLGRPLPIIWTFGNSVPAILLAPWRIPCSGVVDSRIVSR
jgi:hypothetical protein